MKRQDTSKTIWQWPDKLEAGKKAEVILVREVDTRYIPKFHGSVRASYGGDQYEGFDTLEKAKTQLQRLQRLVDTWEEATKEKVLPSNQFYGIGMGEYEIG